MSEELAPSSPGTAREAGRVSGVRVVIGPVVALATLSPTGGGTANLTGTYDADADTFSLSGSGYAIRGARMGPSNAPELMGSVLGPNGTAGMRCVVDGTAVSTFCADYQNGATTRTGRLNFIISGTDISGVAVETGASTGAWLDGTASGGGATRSLAFSGAFAGGQVISVTGVLTVVTGDVLGTWTLTSGGSQIDSGTWSGAECLSGTTE